MSTAAILANLQSHSTLIASIAGRILIASVLVLPAPSGANRGESESAVGNVIAAQRMTRRVHSFVTPPFPVSSFGNPTAGSFGTSVAVEGNTLVVGAGSDYSVGTHGVFVYERYGDTWTLHQTLQPPESLPARNFGYSVALQRDTLLVGAPSRDILTSAGAVYVFERFAGKWVFRQLLQPNDPIGGLEPVRFGAAIDLDGDSAVIGAPGRLGRDPFRGSAYVFARRNGTWVREQMLTDPIGAPFDNFGHAVELSGDLVMVSGRQEDAGSPAGRLSAVFDFRKTEAGWVLNGSLPNPARRTLGLSIRIDDGAHVMAVGARSSLSDEVLIYEWINGVWNQVQVLSGPENSGFGNTVAIGTDTLLIGAPFTQVGSNEYQGAAFLYRLTDGSWHHISTFVAGNGKAEELFAESVAISGDDIVMGAPNTIGPPAIPLETGFIPAYVGVAYVAKGDLFFSDDFEAAEDAPDQSLATSGLAARAASCFP